VSGGETCRPGFEGGMGDSSGDIYSSETARIGERTIESGIERQAGAISGEMNSRPDALIP
jgi:hypothetical protein